jgi:hypothetical protein
VPELLEALVRDPALSAFVAKEFGKGDRLAWIPDEGWPSVPSPCPCLTTRANSYSISNLQTIYQRGWRKWIAS